MSSDNFLEATEPAKLNGFLNATTPEVIPSSDPSTSTMDDFSTPDIDTPVFLQDRKDNILSDVSSQFGDEELRPWRGTRTTFRGLDNMMRRLSGSLSETLEEHGMDNSQLKKTKTGTTDVDRIEASIQDLETNHPNIAASPEGMVHKQELRQRAKAVIDADEIGWMETIDLLIDKTREDPAGMMDLFATGILEDPLLPLLIAGAYRGGAVASRGAAEATGLGDIISILKASKLARERAAGIALGEAVEITGVMGAEASLGFIYEVAHNEAIGKDPMHNATQMAAVAALLGGGFRGLSTAYRMVRGAPGKYPTVEAGLRDMREMGYETVPLVRSFTENTSELPSAGMKDSVNKAKVFEANETIAPFNPYKATVDNVAAHMDDIAKRVTKEFGAEPGVSSAWLDEIVDAKNIFMSGPVKTVGNTVRYSVKKIQEDFDNNFNYLRGLTQKGTVGKSEHNKAQAEAFKNFDFKEFKKWLSENNAKASYAEFLLRMQTNKQKYAKGERLDKVYSEVLEDTLNQMGVDPKRFRNFWTDRAVKGLAPGINYVKRTATEVASNPALLYRPAKDFIQGAKRAWSETVHGPIEGLHTYRKARHELDEMLRTWESSRKETELAINNFANFVKKELRTQDKLTAMSHYMEGNIDAFNAKRIRDGLHAIELTDKDLTMAPVIRKFFNDIIDWQQRSELFTSFRANKHLYNKARNLGRSANNQVDYLLNKTGKELESNAWKYITELNDPMKVAYNISSKAQKKKRKGYDLKYRENYIPHATRRRFAPTENDINDSIMSDSHRAQQLQTHSRFNKERIYDTLLQATDAGVDMITEDVSQLIKMYGKSVTRSQLNNRLLHQLSKMKSFETGKPMIGSKEQVPKYYIEFRHPNFKDADDNFLHVHPDLVSDLKLYFDTSEPMLLNRIVQNMIMISKRASLGLSMFHIMALAWSGLSAGMNPVEVAKNVLPLGKNYYSRGLRGLYGEAGLYEEIMAGMREGVQTGVLEELKGDTLINAMRHIGRFAEEKTAFNGYIKPLGKTVNIGFKTLARTQEIIDTHLWDHVNTGLKLTSYLSTLEKMVNQDVKLAKRQGRAPTEMKLLRRRAAQFTNDAYGNQNWAQMAMNVENQMGHRIAAALNKPSSRGYIRMLVFAPDWSLSNLRVLGKALSGAVPLGKKELAHTEYMKYALRSAVMFAMITDILQRVAGQGSIWDDEGADMLYASLGDGKRMQISKQTSEVVKMLIKGPKDYASRKRGTALKGLEHTDSLGDWVGFNIESMAPIGVKQAIQQGNPAGILGIPITNDYKN